MKYLRSLILIYCFFVFQSSIRAQTEQAPPQPNVIVVICDDLNDAIHGMGGHPQAITPNLDRLARQGVRFTRAYCNAPLCGPSRASLWSGLYPHTTGYYGYNQQKNHWRKNAVLEDAVTVFEQFARNGYQVFATGKIHHNGHEDMSIFTNEDGSNGFSVKASFGPYPWDGDSATAALSVRGVAHPDYPDNSEGHRWSEGIGPVKDISYAYDGKGSWLYDHWGNEYNISVNGERDLMPDERCTEYALSILSGKHQKPFFLTIGYNRPHSPQYVPQEYFDLYGLDTLILSPALENDMVDCAPQTMANRDVHGVNIGKNKYGRYKRLGGERLIKQWTQAYLASVSFVDDQVGTLMQALKDSPHADNTLIIFTSDHGYHMGEKELIFKNTLWEESARVPLLVAGPGVAENQECHNPVSLVDIYPSLLDYCSLPANPNKRGNGKELDGFTMLPLMANPKAGKWNGPEQALSAVCSQQELEVNQAGPVDQQQYSLRSERYRYIRYRNGEEELYDHNYDPYEWFNLASDPFYEEIIKYHKKELHQLIHP